MGMGGNGNVESHSRTSLQLQLRPTVSPSVRQSNAECNVCVDLRLRRVHILVCVWTAGVRGVQSDQSEAPRQAKHH